jgi:hypothetical protein
MRIFINTPCAVGLPGGGGGLRARPARMRWSEAMNAWSEVLWSWKSATCLHFWEKVPSLPRTKIRTRTRICCQNLHPREEDDPRVGGLWRNAPRWAAERDVLSQLHPRNLCFATWVPRGPIRWWQGSCLPRGMPRSHIYDVDQSTIGTCY